MAAGIAKATTGSVLIGDYDPRVQSVHCKRIAGFVPHEPLRARRARVSPLHRLSRGAVERRRDRGAGRRAKLLCERLEGMHEAFSYPLDRRVGRVAAADRARPAAARLRRGRFCAPSKGARCFRRTRSLQTPRPLHDGGAHLPAMFAGAALCFAPFRCVLVRVVRCSSRWRAPAGVTTPLFLCSLLGIVIALDQTPGRHRHLDRCEQSAPLFGRELARAKALVPCIAATLATLLFAGTQFARGAPDAPATFSWRRLRSLPVR